VRKTGAAKLNISADKVDILKIKEILTKHNAIVP
jgi:hypothetical protein